MKHEKMYRGPVEGGFVISKVDAAERQLKTAIWLWFHDFDPVPIHGLAAAAFKVLWKLHEKHKTGHKMIRDEVIARVKANYRQDFIEMLNETENFIKHADRDPFGFHTFNPEMTVMLLLDGVRALAAFNGNFPVECRVFQTWILINRPNLIDLKSSPEWDAAVKAAQPAMVTSKPEFYRLVLHAIQVGIEQAIARQHP
ncbi:hypothetical protein [Paraburkholderia sp. J67]|uniref:hypothetical protein n=1 Tax=Paraburkholderia sp. J67 TaxID=2805435 RepID=UPI002ABE4DA3|nr:hypothetical protein [Paraburkholderia sp. J67]